jgi:hypothetical protein
VRAWFLLTADRTNRHLLELHSKFVFKTRREKIELDVFPILHFRADVIEAMISLLTSLTKPDSSSRSERKEKSQTKNEQKQVYAI